MRAVVTLMLALLLALAGCSEQSGQGPSANEYAAERERLKERLKKKRGRQTAKARRVVEIVEETPDNTGFGELEADYTYVSEGKRDPFKVYVYTAPTGPKIENTGPLGQFEVGQLSVSALIWKTERPAVLVRDPAGKSHIVAEGDLIGKNGGRVIHIGDNLVLVKETYVDFTGEETTKDIEMRVLRSQGG